MSNKQSDLFGRVHVTSNPVDITEARWTEERKAKHKAPFSEKDEAEWLAQNQSVLREFEDMNDEEILTPRNQKKSNGWASKAGGFKRCWESHKPLPIGVGDKTYYIHGGSCLVDHPDMDVFVGLDFGMVNSPLMFPWTKGVAFPYYINDMQAPKNIETFMQLIKYLSRELILGKKVFVGCIGGHGRTGTVFAALVTFMTGNKDSIGYVRKNYCEKAVESATQINFLNTHFGITKEAASKALSSGTSGGGWYSGGGMDSASSRAARKSGVPTSDAKISPVRNSNRALVDETCKMTEGSI